MEDAKFQNLGENLQQQFQANCNVKQMLHKLSYFVEMTEQYRLTIVMDGDVCFPFMRLLKYYCNTVNHN